MYTVPLYSHNLISASGDFVNLGRCGRLRRILEGKSDFDSVLPDMLFLVSLRANPEISNVRSCATKVTVCAALLLKTILHGVVVVE